MLPTRPTPGPRIAVERLEDRVNPGGGTFDPTTGTFNFTVSVRFDATDDEMAQLKTAFQIASDVIADATDGQHRFGRVTIVENGGASNEAEFWVRKVATTADGWPNAQPAGYGTRGLFSNMYFYTSDKTFGTQLYGGNGAGAGYTIAHEFAHQAYGILDEYSGPDGKGGSVTAENAPLSKTEGASLSYSLMDNYFTRGGRFNNASGPFTLNEFSVASNHDPDNDTFQTARNRRNDWAQVARRYPVAVPSKLPTAAAPASQPVTFITDAVGTPYTMLTIDRSALTASGNRLGLIKTGANLFVSSVQNGDRVGVSAYGTTGEALTPLVPINGDAGRQTLTDAINGIQSSGLTETDIYEGLYQAALTLSLASPRSANNVIILAGSGFTSSNNHPLDIIPILQQNNISVISVLLSPDAGPAEERIFRDIATQTGGRYFRITGNDPSEYTALSLAITAERQGAGLLTQAPPTAIGSGETVQQPVEVPPGSGPVTLAVARLDPTDLITVQLVSPSGQTIAAAGPGVEALTGGPLVGFRVANPEPGTWQVVATGGTVNTGGILFTGVQHADPVKVVVDAGRGDTVYPGPVTVRVTPTYNGLNVVGAQVTGFAVAPDGSQTPMVFFDDGLSVHGDDVAGDGVYATLFNNYSNGGSGTYTFAAVVNAFGATTYGGEVIPGGGDLPPVPQPVPSFTRAATGSAIVTGVPSEVVSNDLSVLVTPVGPTSFAVTVQNNGGTDATNARASVFLGNALRLLGGVATQGTFAAGADGTVTFDAGTLAPGATASLTLTVLPRRSGAVNVIADVASADQTDPFLENNEFGLPVPLTRPERVGVGADRGGGALIAVDPATGQQTAIAPFGEGFTGGVRVATGDLTGDGVPDIVAGAGPGGRPEVVVYDGATGTELRRVLGFEESFTGGVYVAVGDFNGDGFADVIITPDEGGGPRVRIFDGKAGDQLADFFGINDPNFRGGARAAAGDVNGDGTPDLLVGAGFGGGPRVAVFDGAKVAAEGRLPGDQQSVDRWESWKLFGDVAVFEPTLRNGVFLTAGDLTGDGAADLIVGGGPGGGPRVYGLSGADLVSSGGQTFTQVANFFAGDPNNRQGVRVTVKDLDGDDLADIVAGSGAAGVASAYAGASVPADGTPPTLTELSPFGPLPFGVFVG